MSRSSRSFVRMQLGDIIELKYGKGLPKRVRIPGEFPVYGSGGVVGTHNVPLVTGPGIIVGRKGSIGSVFYEVDDFYPIDTVFYVEPKTRDIDLFFLSKLLSQIGLDNLNSDAAVPGLNRNTALLQEVSLPPLPIQRKIAAILSAYDDLIENNLRRIQILEEMAQNLYREWFVNFRFPGHRQARFVDSPLGRIPEGWEAKRLGDILELNYGKGLTRKNRCPGPVPVFGSSGVVGHHDKALVDGPGIVVGRKGNVGSVHWSENGFYPIDTTFYVTSDLPLRFLYYDLQTKNFINSDAAVPGLNRNQAYALETVVPSAQIIDSFCGMANDLEALAVQLRHKSDVLRRTRDLLLPKLISGEVDVSELDISIPQEADA